MKLPTLRLRHRVVGMRGYAASLCRSFNSSLLRVISQKGAIHQLIHRTFPLLRDLMNAFAKTAKDNDLRLSPGLLLSRLKGDKLDGVQVNGQKGIVDRSRQFSRISGFIPQELVEDTQEPDIVNSKMNASPFGHDSYRLQTAIPATEVHGWYIYMTLGSCSRVTATQQGCGALRRGCSRSRALSTRSQQES